MKHHPMGPPLHGMRDGRVEEEREKTRGEVEEEGGKGGGVVVESV